MNDEEFRQLVDQANHDLQRKQVALVELWNLMDFKTYWFDQAAGKLQFKDSYENVGIEASVIPIGSFSMKSNSWHWSWANQTIVPDLRAKSEQLQGLSDITGRDLFRTRTFEADETLALNLVAVAVAHLNCIGCYRMPIGQLHVYLAIERIDVPSSAQRSAPDNPELEE
jgi:hypothetical protein